MNYYTTGGGTNPKHGPDRGLPPPPAVSGPQAIANPSITYHVPTQPQLVGLPMYSSAPVLACAYSAPVIHGGPVRATGPPVKDAEFPSLHMRNSMGGTGPEPGYNVFHPPGSTTKIHVFRTGKTPPWDMPDNFSFPFMFVHVPCSTTIGALLAGFGATNKDASKNKVWECIPGSNGSKWYKGMCFTGKDGKDMAKTIKSVGWDKSRNGLPGGKPVVYLYITKS